MKIQLLLSSLISACFLILANTLVALAQTQEQSQPGTIQGTVIYPSEILLAQKVCVANIQTKKNRCIETKQSQVNFSIQVQPGTYYVFATACNKSYRKDKLCSDGYSKRRAYYNIYVQCGLTYQCTQTVKVNSPIPVRVNPKQIVSGIKPHDWYTKQSDSKSSIALPGRCHMGQCWDNKFIGKSLLKSDTNDELYLVKIASRSWSIDSQPPDNFEQVKTSYVYCSTTKPAYIFNTDNTYYAHLLNPGSDWYGYNQSDYPIYWTTCHNFVGPDFFSEEMTARAIKLGYSLNLSSDQIELNNPLEIMDY